MDTAPIGWTRAPPARPDCRTMKPTAAWLSVTGSVFGIAQIAVNPPTAAACAPVATVSSSSFPGSRKCTCRSISPGTTTLPFTLRTSAPSGADRPRFTSVILPSWIRTSAASSRSQLGSMTCPPWSRIGRVIRSLPRAWPRQPARPGRRRAVFGAAFHRPGVHDRDVARRALEPLRRHAEHAIVLAQRRDEAFLHPLELEPQHVQHVRPFDPLFDPAEDLDPQLGDPARQQRPRTAHRDFGAELGEPPDVGAGDARVQHVAHETHFQALDLAVLVANRQQVEQRLRRMLVLAVARVDDVRRDAVAEKLRRPRAAVRYAAHFDPHRLDFSGGIPRLSPFRARGAARRHVDGIRRE